MNHDIVINDSEVVDKFEIMYSPPDLDTVRKRNELIINISNPEVFRKSINLSLEIDVLSVSFITNLNEFINYKDDYFLTNEYINLSQLDKFDNFLSKIK